jgi:hypothetical protein
LTVITSAQATKINWTGGKDRNGNVVAQGVSFVPVGGGAATSVVRSLLLTLECRLAS